jgi:hypothetical protein
MPNLTPPKFVFDFLNDKNFKILEDDKETGKIVATYRGVIKLTIIPDEVLYEVKVNAKDDASDSIEEITHDPLRTLVEFIGTGVGEEFLTKMTSLKPKTVSKILRQIASGLIDNNSVKILRRLAVSLTLFAFLDVCANRVAKRQNEFEKTTIEGLKKRMKDKGWDVFEVNPLQINVDIGDQFEAEILIDTLIWDYNLEVIGGDISVSQRTDDPVKDIIKFMRRKDINDILKEAKLKIEETKTVAPNYDKLG